MVKVFRNTIRPQDPTTAGVGALANWSVAVAARALPTVEAGSNRATAQSVIHLPAAGAEAGPWKLLGFSRRRISGT